MGFSEAGLPFELTAAEGTLERDAPVLPRGDRPDDGVGAEADDGKEEGEEDEDPHEPDVEPRDLRQSPGDAADDPVALVAAE